MKKLLISMLLLLLFVRIEAQTDYYWYRGEKINLPISNHLFYVSSTDSVELEKATAQKQLSVFSAASTVKRGVSDGTQKKYWKIINTGSTTAKQAANLKTLSAVAKAENMYIAPVVGDEDNPVATTEYFYVRLKSEGDYNLLVKEATTKNCEILYQLPYMPLWYRLKAPLGSCGLAMANAFYETGKFQEKIPIL